MQGNAEVIREMGILADEAYENDNFSPDHVIENNDLQHSYTVVATQDTLIGNLFPNLFGFQAMLLKDSSNNFVIGFRGTEGDAPIWNAVSDIAADASMAVGNFTEQMMLTLAFVQEALETYGSDGLSTNNLTFTGHSLGGSLAEVAGYTFGSDTYAYNPFGVELSLATSPIAYNGTLAVLGITSAQSTGNIINIVNVGGSFSDPLTGFGSHLLDSYIGEINYVKDRDGGNSQGLAPHGISDLNESIAVYNTLLEIFPSQNYNSLTELLDPIFPIDKQVPRFLDSLGAIVGATKTDDLKTFVTNIKNASPAGMSLTSLANMDASSLQSQASNKAHLYALLELNPFAVIGADYSGLNQNGELERENYTDQFVEDRSRFLNYLAHPDATVSNFDPDINFVDNHLGISLVVGNGMYLDGADSQYLFSNLEGELLEGGSAVDHLYGMEGNDILKGYDDADYLEGGKDNDYLDGGAGDDTLVGGAGIDTYVISGHDRIIDTGRNNIIFNGQLLAGAFKFNSSSGVYEFISDDGGYQLAFNSPGQLTLSAEDSITFVNQTSAAGFADNDFNIKLLDNPDTTDPSITGITVRGDLAPTHDYDYDEWGNIITNPGQPAPGREDFLRDSPGNDHLLGYGGIDLLQGIRGGDDIYEGGSGDDWIEDDGGNDLLIGGTDSDAMFGGKDNDRLFATDKLEPSVVYEAGEIGIGTGTRGDLLSGEDGDDQLYGDSGNDILSGGAGADIIYAGAGDDVIEGDDVIYWASSADYPWAVSRLVFVQGGATIYQRTYDSVGSITPALEQQGDDVIFSGTGNDWIFAQGGNDFIDAGADDDVVFGEAGDDMIFGQSGNDVLNGDSGSTPANEHGNDYLDGGDGDDLLFGLLGDDILNGGVGEDELQGGEGNDLLNGDGGNDVLFGQEGNDTLDGGTGTDTMVGGLGDDTYMVDNASDVVFEYASEGIDTVQASSAYTLGANIENLIMTGISAINCTGNNLNNVLNGNKYDNILDGGAGSDTMLGGAGNDTYIVENVSDIVIENSGEGNDTVESSITYTLGDNLESLRLEGYYNINGTGNELDNYILGNERDNILTGGAGNDTLDGYGHTGLDKLFGGSGDDYYIISDSFDTITEYVGEGTDTVESNTTFYTLGANVENLVLRYYSYSAINGTGNELDNYILGNERDNILTGGAGNDTLYGFNGNDVLVGGLGNDTYTVSDNAANIYNPIINNITIIENTSEGTDTVQSWKPTYTLEANVENLTLVRSTDSPVYGGIDGTGNFLDNVLLGNSFANILAGGLGSDTLYGGENDDVLFGDNTDNSGNENDTLYGDAGNDIVFGAGGNDHLDGGVGDDILNGGDGDDVIFGGEGNDVLYGVENEYGTWGGPGGDTLYGDISNNTGIGNDILYGGAGDDVLIGAVGDDQLDGGDGNDGLDGGAGADILNGGVGTDSANYSSSMAAIYGNLLTGEMSGGYAEGDTLVNIENILGSSFDDILIGDNQANVFEGFEGNDILDGGAGNDTLLGGMGNDTLDGGAGADEMRGDMGDDTYIVDTSSDIIFENTDYGTDTIETSVTLTLTNNVENLKLTGLAAINGTGNTLNNVLIGNNAANTLNGGTGTDILSGGLGNDIYIIDNVGDIITEGLNEGTDTAQSNVTYILGDNIENLTLSGTLAINGTGNGLDNVLIGNGQANTLTGGAGHDLLDGGAGADKMFGGTGNDTFVVNISTDVITENDNEGSDTVQSSITYTLGSYLENLTLTGSSVINGTGNTLSNILIGNTAANTLSGGTGIDSMLGGLGNDIYVVDNVEDIITEYLNEGTDTVQSSVTYTLLDHLENMTLTGSGPINGTGNILDNILTGNSGVNMLTGGGGNDTLNGGAGNDILDGGIGSDVMSGGTGNDTYIVDVSADTITESASGGTDTVQSSITYILGINVENLTLTGSAAVNGTGNDLANALMGNSNDNTLMGGLGVDTLTGGAGNDTLDGGTGADKMLGGLGNDTYVVDVSTDTITENASEGTDTVQSTITLTLGTNLENLTLLGSSAINGTGNTVDNVLMGNSGINTLSGGTGNDTLNGGLGNDVLTGGAGNDFFVFDTALNASTNKDSISDFTAGSDKIQLDKTIFTSLADEGTLLAAYFKSSTTGIAGDANDFFLYNTSSGALLYDLDGNGQGVAVQFATLTTKPAITANDFLVTA